MAALLSFGANAQDKIAKQEQKRIEKVKNHRKDHFQKHFSMMDANKDKVISKQEWQNIHEKRFNEMDANKNGSVDEKEFRAHNKKMRDKYKKHAKNKKAQNGDQ
jgi:Ca2+-binding EF-hand superfamily protein